MKILYGMQDGVNYITASPETIAEMKFLESFVGDTEAYAHLTGLVIRKKGGSVEPQITRHIESREEMEELEIQRDQNEEGV